MNAESVSPISAIHPGFQRFLVESLERHGIGPFLGFLVGHRAPHYRFVQEALNAQLRDPANESTLLEQVLHCTPIEYMAKEEKAMTLLRELPIVVEESHD